MPTVRLFLVLVFCLIGVEARAQPVLTVGGASPNFADLPQAVAAALPGSILEVRPGNYTGFSTNKPLHVVLDFTAATGSVQAPPGSAYAITVSGLFAGRFSLVGRGATVQAGSLGAIRIANTGAYVMVQGITVSASAARIALDLQNTATVFIERCTLAGTPALQLQDAIVVASDVSCTSSAGFAVLANRCLLDFSLGSFRGFQVPAIRVSQCGMRLAGNGTTPIVVTGAPAGPATAFESIDSLVQWQPNSFQLTPAGGAPGFVISGGAWLPADIPSLVTSGAALGSTATAHLRGQTPMPGLIGFNTLAPQLTLFQLTGLYLNTVGTVIAAIGIVDPTGLSLSVTVPSAPTLRGQSFCLQGVAYQANGAPVWSAPGLWTVL